MRKIQYHSTKEFDKDVAKLCKRFSTLRDDIEVSKVNALELRHIRGIDNRSIFELQGIYTDALKVYKVKKFSCRSLKGRGNQSGIRLIYAFSEADMCVTFIEAYFKGDKEHEDRVRIQRYMQSQ